MRPGSVIEALVHLARRRQVLDAARGAQLRVLLRAAEVATVADARAWLRSEGAVLGAGAAQALSDYLAPDDRPLFAAYLPLGRLADRSDGADWLAFSGAGEPVLARSLAGDASAPERFARAVALRHPALVPCLDAGSDGNRVWFLVQEFSDQPTLAEVTGARRPLADSEALAIAFQLAEAAAALHRLGLAHGAISADSALATASGLVRLRPPVAGNDLAGDLNAIGSTVRWLIEPAADPAAADTPAAAFARRCLAPGGFLDAGAMAEAAGAALEAKPRAEVATARYSRAAMGGDDAGTMLVAPRAASAPIPAAPAPATTEAAPVIDGDPATALADPWLALLAAGGHSVQLYAKTSIALGKLCEPPADICVRKYPTATNREACLSVSRQHLRLQYQPATAEVLICDLGSANGSTLDGRALGASRPQALVPDRQHEVVLANVMRLGVRCCARAGAAGSAMAAAGLEHDHAMDAVVISRLDNLPAMAYAMVLRRITIGATNAQLALAGAPGGAPAELAYHRGRWLWRADSGAWRPLRAGTALRCGGIDLVAHAGTFEVFRG